MNTINLINDKIETPSWDFYNQFADSIMAQMGYSSAVNKLTLLMSAMQITSAREYSAELDMGTVEFQIGDEVLDLTMYTIISSEGVSLYLDSHYLDVVHSTLSSLGSLYSDMRELITMVINDPIS
jgi:hypothetical protein